MGIRRGQHKKGPFYEVLRRAPLWLLALGSAGNALAGPLSIVWEQAAEPTASRHVLAHWELDALKKLKNQVEQTEPDAAQSGKSARFIGPSLADLVNEAAKGLTAEQRSRIDLVVLSSSKGQAFMPRAFLQKYRAISLAVKRDGKELGEQGPFVVLPLDNSKIHKEGITLDSLAVTGVREVLLTSYRDRFGSFFLQRRTDPAAMRGEKLFMQNCTSCHSSLKPEMSLASIIGRAEAFEKNGHPKASFKAQLDGKELRSIRSYLEAYRLQTASTK